MSLNVSGKGRNDMKTPNKQTITRHWKIIAAIISGIGILVSLIVSLATIKEKGPEALDILGSVTYFTGVVTFNGLALVALFFFVHRLARWLNFSEEASRNWAWIITVGVLIYYVPKDFLASLAFQHSSLSGFSPLFVRGVGAIVLIVAGFALYRWLAPIISADIDGEDKQTVAAQESGATPSPAPPRAASATSVSSTATVAVDEEGDDDTGDEITGKLPPLSKGPAPESPILVSIGTPAASAAPTVNTSAKKRKVKSRHAKQHIWLRWLVVICVAVGVYAVNNDALWSRFVSKTPYVMFNKFCSALAERDYQTAYAQFSEGFQKAHSEQEFEQGYARYTACKHDQPDVSSLDAATQMTLSDTAGSYKAIVVFILDKGDWRIADITFP